MRALTLLVVAALSGPVHGQAVRAKQLLTSYGVGAGWSSLSSATEVLVARGSASGSVQFAAGYALSERISLGVHYDRLGSTEHPGPFQRFRITHYHFELKVRPIVRERGAMEFGVGLGPAIMVLAPRGSRLQARANGGSLGIGLRYIRMLGATLGAYAGADITAGNDPGLTLEDAPVLDDRGAQVRVGWSAFRVGAGLVVRF
jgi:hypothetical protein